VGTFGDFDLDAWPAKAADLVQQFVDRVRDQIVRPIIVVVRGFVFGLLMVSVAITVLVAGSIAAIRLLDVYCFGHQVWISYAILAAVLIGGGSFVFSKHHRTAAKGANRG
jgi:hypothetical protein